MSYTVIQLITEALYASGIVSREFETVSGTQMNDGVNFLNQILADTTIEKDMIPYFSKYDFTVTAGVEQYFIPNLESPDTLVFFLQDVRYQMRYIPRKSFRGSSRPNNISSLPFNWNFERCAGGGIISVYFFPQENYPLEIWGLFRLPSVAVGQDLTSSLATYNLGIPSFTGNGTFSPGQIVINGYDLAQMFIAPVVAAATEAFAVVYNNGVDGVGATLTNNGVQETFNIDGIQPNVGDRVLMGLQANPAYNGIYTVTNTGSPITNWVLTRSTDFDTPTNMFQWATTTVLQGIVFAGTSFTLSTIVATVGASAVTFLTYSANNNLVAYINTGVIPNITAFNVLNNIYVYNNPESNVLSSNTVATGANITLSTVGTPYANNISFSNFSTTTGPLNPTYYPMLLDLFYISYLQMRLAERFCIYYNFILPPGVAKLLSEYQENISKRSAPMDLTQQRISTFANGNCIDWAQVNLGLGWTTG